MGMETLRMMRCDHEGCGALETMPEPEIGPDEVTMPFAPKDWLLVVGNTVKAYCPTCKYLHSEVSHG